ncbi:MAG: alpha/beta fold hydrolase, partial [Myxococcota bacterium]
MPTADRQEPKSQSRNFKTQDGVVLHSLYWEPKSQASETLAAPVILLHGGGANAHWWDAVAIRLALNRAVYALDFRGHGDSSYPTTREIGAFNSDLEALLSSIGRENVVLVGHSMGAAVALDH